MNLKRTPDFTQFLKVLRREGRPTYLPFYEHLATANFIARRTNTAFDRMDGDHPDRWRIYVDFWLGMGYDCIPMEIAPNMALRQPAPHDNVKSRGSESHAVIGSWADFESHTWPEESNPITFRHFETVAALLPDGVRIVGGVCGGPYEWVSSMMGVMGLSYALVDCPELVAAMFERVGALHTSALRQLATMDGIGALRQGDDLGFKTSTFLSPPQLRQYVFPIYKEMAAIAHAHDMPFILHSCGNLAEVYDDLIDDCRIDAKHSFEDIIMPVTEFQKEYGHRITPLGGLDVDIICRRPEDELRAYARRMIETCLSDDGYWALGTGNSLTDYMPVENYVVMLEEGIRLVG